MTTTLTGKKDETLHNITDRGDNAWRIVVRMGTGADGKPIRYAETFHGSKSAAKSRRNEILTSKDKGIIMPQARLTLTELIRGWLHGYVATQCAPRTQES